MPPTPETVYSCLDEALICGPQRTLSSFPNARAALNHLLAFEVQTATDPKVNGGKVLVEEKELQALRTELQEAYAEMRKQRKTLTAVFHRRVWERAEQARPTPN